MRTASPLLYSQTVRKFSIVYLRESNTYYGVGIGGKDLKDGDVVVDVGGSVGAATLILYEAFPNLSYVVQDLKKQIVAAEGVSYGAIVEACIWLTLRSSGTRKPQTQ